MLPELLDVFRQAGRTRFEIIIVDDNSPDGTGDVADELAAVHPGFIRVVHRPGKAGLGTAVVAGWQVAHAPVLAAMDADGQHPPAVLVELLRAIEGGAELAVASRYVSGGQTQGWSPLRLLGSRLGTLLTRLLLPSAASLCDPLSGCFALRREVIAGRDLQPLGYKILLEVLARGRARKVVEAPYTFTGRQAGRSKASVKELADFLLLLIRLRQAALSSAPAQAAPAPPSRSSWLARLVFPWVRWQAARGGLQPEDSPEESEQGRERRRTGVRGETYAYWYLRRQGYTVVARNYRVPHRHGEIDLIGWDAGVLAFVEVKTRTTATGGPPEDAVNHAKQHHVVGMAEEYLRRCNLAEVRYRFDILAIEAQAGAAPVVRLHKGAFGAA